MLDGLPPLRHFQIVWRELAIRQRLNSVFQSLSTRVNHIIRIDTHDDASLRTS